MNETPCSDAQMPVTRCPVASDPNRRAVIHPHRRAPGRGRASTPYPVIPPPPAHSGPASLRPQMTTAKVITEVKHSLAQDLAWPLAPSRQTSLTAGAKHQEGWLDLLDLVWRGTATCASMPLAGAASLLPPLSSRYHLTSHSACLLILSEPGPKGTTNLTRPGSSKMSQ